MFQALFFSSGGRLLIALILGVILLYSLFAIAKGIGAIFSFLFSLVFRRAGSAYEASWSREEMAQDAASATFDDIFERLREEAERYSKSRDSSSQANSFDGTRDLTQDNKLKHAYETLGLKSSASVEEIKAAYKNHVKLYHPDRVAATAGSPEVQQLATDLTRRIRDAYELVLKHASARRS